MTADVRLETPKQLALRVGLSGRQVRHLIETRQLEHVMIGCRVHIPCGAFERFVEERSVKPCQDETRVQGCDGSKSEGAITSPGQSTVGAASAARALQIAKKLKESLPNGFSPESGDMARVIHLKSS